MKMNKNTLASLVLISSGLSLSAHAADSFNINVTGVISPAACQANITGGETIDYGNIPANSLTTDAVTLLPAKQTAFTLTCDAPAKLGFRVIDNRAASKMTSGEGFIMDSGISYNYSVLNGLGVDAKGNNIGGWMAELINLTRDAESNNGIVTSLDDGVTWRKSAVYSDKFGLYSMDSVNRLVSVTDAGGSVPVAFSTLTGTLSVQTAINPASTLDLSQPVTLDGSITVEMVYL
ncbi:DUF1120 domain-containing protein [Enterobacter chuandaensis]|uniref:DUF1120 domain-containing protein n=1 Tax=Enterobacter chuandaensis TaxID=2497875 RepID=UPI002074E914|nr:DUF1120 domain-containing protein [Enterobacter chuandaensis]MCM7588020.1 DUF1120 domain-containing protein [Enterobacter chuandaensis]